MDRLTGRFLDIGDLMGGGLNVAIARSTVSIAEQPARIVQMVERAIIGQRKAVELAVSTVIAGGHLLIEDVPGVGKTTLARALAKAIGGEFSRIQFTSDLMPTDIVGVSVWDAKATEFLYKPGPIFAHVVLADEINRAAPKTQSALLEAMSEGQVSVDGTTKKLARPFLVIATQNEQERHGTYPLPESQLDRFLMRITIGYPDPASERRVISRPDLQDPVSAIEPVIVPEQLLFIAAEVDRVQMDEAILDYIMEIIQRTRDSSLLTLGVGPRGGMALHRAARARAVLYGRNYCLIDDVKELALPVLAHRIESASATDSSSSRRDLGLRAISNILESLEIPI